jgi:hypothetical protein
MLGIGTSILSMIIPARYNSLALDVKKQADSKVKRLFIRDVDISV